DNPTSSYFICYAWLGLEQLQSSISRCGVRRPPRSEYFQFGLVQGADFGKRSTGRSTKTSVIVANLGFSLLKRDIVRVLAGALDHFTQPKAGFFCARTNQKLAKSLFLYPAKSWVFLCPN
ncbi:MAG: hypothetical protein MUC83_16965, partial [Pirellula sp.]|nr:hypothetical protein [Pirellula sp.]